MNPRRALTLLCGLALLGLLTACERKPAPLKEGSLSSVRWSPTPGVNSGLYRMVKPETEAARLPGSYGVEMRGVLHPTLVEVRYPGGHLIIPLSQIQWLEFTNGEPLPGGR